MLSAFTSRCHDFIWFLIFTFTLSCMPHLDLVFPYRLRFSVREAQAAETTETTVEAAPVEESSGEAPVDKTEPISEETEALASAASEDSSTPAASSGLTFKVDDFTGSAHLSYPIAVPPGRGPVPTLSFNYSSSGGNGLVGVGWDLTAGGFIQRRGPRKAVPKYNDTEDIFELNLGGAPQELVPIGNGEYRLRIEGAYLKITYYPSSNYWEVLDKSGLKMRFGLYGTDYLTKYPGSKAPRTGKNPSTNTGTYRWYLDRVEDPRTNYMEFVYTWLQDDPGQIYLSEIYYNGQVTPNLSHNHKVTFNRGPSDPADREDPIYDYRGGFRMLTRKRLSSVEVWSKDANNNFVLVRKYQLGYKAPLSDQQHFSARSLLESITLYEPGGTNLPPAVFSYQAIDNRTGYETARGFGPKTQWQKDTAGGEVNYNYIRNGGQYQIKSDVIDLDGDALPDRLIKDQSSPYDSWEVHKNTARTAAGFNPSTTTWSNRSDENNIRDLEPTSYDVIDFDGDGLPDRIVSPSVPDPYDSSWTVYLNNRNGFDYPGITWSNPSAWWILDEWGYYYYYAYNIREGGEQTSVDVVDMNGDGLPDRVVYAKGDPDPYNMWTVYFNNGENGFIDVDSPNWVNGSYDPANPGTNYIRVQSVYGVKYDRETEPTAMSMMRRETSFTSRTMRH